MEKLAGDLKSDDKDKRKAAEDKLKEMAKQANAQDGKKPPAGPKPTDKQLKEFGEAAKDLTSKDPKKKAAAEKKLDGMIGEGNRKELQQTLEDLKSDGKAKREAAQKKVEQWKKDAEEQVKKDGKGKEPTPAEVADLTKKAQDLKSPDDTKRKQAEKDLDEKLGKENRDKLAETAKGMTPGDPKDTEKLKKQVEEMAKNPPMTPQEFKDKWKQGLGSSPAAKEAMDDDPKNRLKSAELLLEEFEKRKFDDSFRAKKGWTKEEYDRFLEGYRKRVEDLRAELLNGTDKGPTASGPTDPTSPLFTPGGGSKVEARPDGTTGGNAGNQTVPPPGFEDTKRKFQELIKKKK